MYLNTVNNEQLCDANKITVSIENEEILEFVIFCIEKLKDEMKIDGKDAYGLLTKETDILYQYIVKNYITLHTQSEKYIVNDLKEILSKKSWKKHGK